MCANLAKVHATRELFIFKVHLSRNPAEGPIMLSTGIVGVLCNILCLAVLQKQQVGGKVEALIIGYLFRPTLL